jgi:hypothetical protein
LFTGNSARKRGLLTVYIRIKHQVDLQVDKSPAVVKGPFFPRVMDPRYRICGTNVWCKSWSNKAEKFDLQEVKPMHLILKNIMKTNLIYWKPEVARDRGGWINQSREIGSSLCWSSEQRRSKKFNLIKSFFKSRFPFRLRKRPPFGATVPWQCTPIRAG